MRVNLDYRAMAASFNRSNRGQVCIGAEQINGELLARALRSRFDSYMSTETVSFDLIRRDDVAARCWWCGSDPLYAAYHDQEWGFPVLDEQRLFEKICLEGFQAGLSWLTILRKRARFREVFAEFDPQRIARFTKRDVNRLVKDAGIIRHRGKIESVINNAKRYLALRDGGMTLVGLIYDDGERCLEERPKLITRETIPALTPHSTALSRFLKRRGWTFVGPTTLYATMQAVGAVNDHVEGCCVRESAESARRSARHALAGSNHCVTTGLLGGREEMNLEKTHCLGPRQSTNIVRNQRRSRSKGK